MMKVPAAALSVALLALTASGAEPPKLSSHLGGGWNGEAKKGPFPAVPEPAKEPVLDPEASNLRLQVVAAYGDLKNSADFVVENAVQANHVAGGEKRFKTQTPKGETVEFKKWGFIVNVLPVNDPNHDDTVSLQIQLELSGPEGPDGDVSTWQLQTSVRVKKGVKTVIASASGRAEVTVTDAP